MFSSILDNLCLFGTINCSFFFQAEDGIRDSSVTGVQTCALPISFINKKGGAVYESGAGIGSPQISPRERRCGCRVTPASWWEPRRLGARPAKSAGKGRRHPRNGRFNARARRSRPRAAHLRGSDAAAGREEFVRSETSGQIRPGRPGLYRELPRKRRGGVTLPAL